MLKTVKHFASSRKSATFALSIGKKDNNIIQQFKMLSIMAAFLIISLFVLIFTSRTPEEWEKFFNNIEE